MSGRSDEGAYGLGIDVGTTYTAAAISVGDAVEMAAFGHHATSIPSVVYVGESGDVLVGDAAVRRATSEPQSIAREFKRRVGDSTPLIVGGRPLSVEILTSELLKAVTRDVATERARWADAVVLTHPANWGAYKRDVLLEAARLAGVTVSAIMSEPEAAATWYASQQRVTEGATIAVFDLGGGTFDATVLQRTVSGFTLLGEPRGVDRLGGIDFDEAVFRFVLESASLTPDSLDAEDPATAAAVVQLRRDCVEAKEALSSDTTVSVNVFLPGRNVSVRITRAEFEHLISPMVDHAVTALSRALDDAHLTVAETDAVLLVGGSSRIPLVGRRVTEALGVPVTLDAHPKHSVALGAGLAAARVLGHGNAAEPAPVVSSVPAPPAEPPASQPSSVEPEPVAPPVDLRPESSTPRRSRRAVALVAVAVVAVAGIAAALLVTRDGDTSVPSAATAPDATGSEASKSEASKPVAAEAAPLPFGFVDDSVTECGDNPTAGFGQSIVLAANGDFLVADGSNHDVKRVDRDGHVTSFAGTRTQGSSGDGGPATEAQLDDPTVLAIDASGAVFIADDAAGVIRKVDPNGTISTVVGATEPVDSVGGMVFDTDGALLVSQRLDGIFRADPNDGFQLEPFVAAEKPGALALDVDGRLVFQDGDKIRRRGDDGTLTTIAGTGTAGHSGDGGPATEAQTCVPDGIAVDSRGNIYFADSHNERIRGIGTDGIMLTLAGSSAPDARDDANNPQELKFFTAKGVTVDDAGFVYFIDGFDIFEVDATGRSRNIAKYSIE